MNSDHDGSDQDGSLGSDDDEEAPVKVASPQPSPKQSPEKKTVRRVVRKKAGAQ